MISVPIVIQLQWVISRGSLVGLEITLCLQKTYHDCTLTMSAEDIDLHVQIHSLCLGKNYSFWDRTDLVKSNLKCQEDFSHNGSVSVFPENIVTSAQ